MSDPNLARIEADLATMKQAAGLGAPFNPRHVWANLAMAASGILVATVTAFTNIAALPVTQGSPRHLAYIALILMPIAVLCFGIAIASRRRGDTAIQPQAVMNRIGFATAIAIALSLVFVPLATSHGLSAPAITAALFFAIGLIWTIHAITTPGVRHYLPVALLTLLGSLVIPQGDYTNAGILAGSWLATGGLLTACTIAWRLRQESPDRAR